ncbi:MAG: sigma-54-dependent Fis family transcriptional regulator [Acidobacteria bacterium]|nr:sigma-54-dependent Fis family transcriptional regulator [Acidobacteriota bacterium]
MTKPKILVIDDDTNVLDLMQFHLHKNGFDTVMAESGATGINLLTAQSFDLVLTDMRLPDRDGIDLVRESKEIAPDTEIIVITGYSSINKAVEATKAGAYQFVEKPVNYERLLLMVQQAIERREHRLELKKWRDRMQPASYGKIIGSSRAMQNIYAIIESVAASDANVLIVGESGTGKELVAGAVHERSLRAKKPFVKINCAALPKELIESEMFGHTRGAFTGAARDKDGLISQAHGGSLLMDEIGEMPSELQPKLLRVLQERVYTPVGSEKPSAADFRLICSTNRNPLDAIREGLLREDLYYRINTIEIHVPPLRERTEDVQRLAEHFLTVFAEKYERPARELSREAYERLFNYSWPGNVRELQNVMERAVLMTKSEVIQADELPMTNIVAAAQTCAVQQSPGSHFNGTQPAAASTSALTEKPDNADFNELCRLMVNVLPTPSPGNDSQNIFERLEGCIVQAALYRTKGNKQAAANLLGLYRPRLYSIIKKHHLLEGNEA